jgi:hypothetical protein
LPTIGPAIQGTLKDSPDTRIIHQVIELYGNGNLAVRTTDAASPSTARTTVNAVSCSNHQSSTGVTKIIISLILQQLQAVNATTWSLVPATDNRDYGQLAAPNTATTG